MPSEESVTLALKALANALSGLDDAIENRLDRDRELAGAEDEARRLNADRIKLAHELDQSEDRANRLEDANKEVSRRLVTAMETIRAVLDRS